MNGSVEIQEAVLAGAINSTKSLTGCLYQENKLIGSLSLALSHPAYTGDYEFIPKTELQTAMTKDRYLNNDITIQAIPIDKVSNDYGITVTIGAHYGE